MSTRRMKVYEKPGSYNYSSGQVPEMRIGGMWLSKAGFNIGDHVELAVEEDQITIRRIVAEEPELKPRR